MLGDRLKARLAGLQPRVPEIAEVRGPGSMVAVEFLQPGTHTPAAEFTRQVQEQALARGLVLLICGMYGNVIRFLYPLTIEDDLFDEAMAQLEAALLAAKAPA